MSAAGTRRAWALTLGGAWYAFLRAWEGRAKPTEDVLKFGGYLVAPDMVQRSGRNKRDGETLELARGRLLIRQY